MCIHAAEMNMQEFINEEGEDFSVEEQKTGESISTVHTRQYPGSPRSVYIIIVIQEIMCYH